jgi:hypothetical protein
MSDVEITGGAGPHEAAAVMAAIAHSLDEEAAALSVGAVSPRPTDWQLVASDHLKSRTEPGPIRDSNAPVDGSAEVEGG